MYLVRFHCALGEPYCYIFCCSYCFYIVFFGIMLDVSTLQNICMLLSNPNRALTICDLV